MGLNSTPSSERIHIGFFGMRNAGKSSLVNRITNQEISVVSDVKGTTTDPVKKTMELLPIGPVVIIDTPGYDDEGELGKKRVDATKKILQSCDIAILVSENTELSIIEKELVSIFRDRGIPYLIVHNKSDLEISKSADINVSAINNDGIDELKNKIATSLKIKHKEIKFVGDFVSENDIVILVTPIDESAPKGRMILPQQQAIRDVIDAGGNALVLQPEQLVETLNSLKKSPALVVTDSQVFSKVMKLVPNEIPLTSFSILMARYKGFLDTAVSGAKEIENLKDNAKILISEGCTHHRQCNDIGTVKMPKWLREYTGKELQFEFTSGHGFPDDLSSYDLVIHCGGCMLNDTEMKYRMNSAITQGIPFTNYGTVIAHMNGILERSTEIIYSKKPTL